VPKAVYRSSCHDKRNRPRRESNLGLLPLQSDALTTRPLRPVNVPHPRVIQPGKVVYHRSDSLDRDPLAVTKYDTITATIRYDQEVSDVRFTSNSAVFFSAADRRTEYCDERVCLFICSFLFFCLSAIIYTEVHV